MRKHAKRRKKPLTLSQILGSTLLTAFFLIAVWIWEAAVPLHLPSSDQPVELYANQTYDDFQKLFVQAIQSAQESVVLVIYSLKDHAILKALRKKAEQGVPVYVVCDAEGTPQAKKDLACTDLHIRKGSGIMHQKILVIDQKQAWIGSANMTYQSLRTHGNLIFGMEHPVLAGDVIEKAKSLPREGKGPCYPHRTYQFADQQGELWFLPDEPEAVEKVKSCLRAAEKTIRVAMYTWTRTDLADEIVAARKRGVDARVVIDGSQGEGVCKNLVSYLREHGVPTGLSRGEGLLHHKFAYIDGRTLVNGSANWTKAAFTRNDDCFMILSPLTEEQSRKMDRVWEVIERESDLSALITTP